MKETSNLTTNKQGSQIIQNQLAPDKEKEIRDIIDIEIEDFIEKFEDKHKKEVKNPKGVINMKKNNFLIAEASPEFLFYNGLSRSFDSRLGHALQNIGNRIAGLTYEVRSNINGYILPDQYQCINSLLHNYQTNNAKPEISHYNTFTCIKPKNIESHKRSLVTDNYFYDKKNRKHYLIELKASGRIDIKKSKSEKMSLLEQYFLLKNSLEGTNETVEIFFGTGYNRFGEGNEWKQDTVLRFFAQDELLIGKDYWNFCCGSQQGFEIVFDQYKKNAPKITKSLQKIKETYFESGN